MSGSNLISNTIGGKHTRNIHRRDCFENCSLFMLTLKCGTKGFSALAL